MYTPPLHRKNINEDSYMIKVYHTVYTMVFCILHLPDDYNYIVIAIELVSENIIIRITMLMT